MPESFINQTEGSGKKAHTYQRVIGGNTVEDQVTLIGEPYLATYVVNGATPSTATAASHLLQIMAGASLNLYVRSIYIYQVGLATVAAIDEIDVVRLSTAGTGGTPITPAALDPSDAAAGATAMLLPTVKGTEGSFVWKMSAQFTQTVATQSGGYQGPLIGYVDFEKLRGKALRIAAGVANGIAIKNPTARAGATVLVTAVITEANF